MGRRVDQILGNLPLEQKPEAVLAFLEREIRPIVSRLRESNNEIVEELAGIDLTAIEADITALEAAVAALQTDVTALEAAVAALETIATDHETRIAALEAAETTFKTTTYSGYGWPSNSTILNGGGPYYMTPVGTNVGSAITVINDRRILWGRSGTLTNFRFKQQTSSGDADTFQVFLNINGADTALGFTGVAGTDTATKGPDTSQVSISAGDLLVISIDADGGASTATADQTWAFDFIDGA